ncbi:ATP-binding cassette domain-containing protein [Duganella sp. FT92W]|uniref:ATP-binding cassette domain-containing protein n=1 Tax=Pseudoduganella rivuli TaxID=2666085 RepID=A0A7X2LVY2_9BURK|nr:ATP-binding cassette domain-containing protein [Pseudoduganella rivuli]
MDPSTDAVRIRNVTKIFAGIPVVEDLSLDIPQGCLYVLLGPNGAGKTTTLRMLVGLTHPDTGTINILGQDVADGYARTNAHIAYLPDEPLLYDLLKPVEYMDFVAGLWSIEPTVAKRRSEELLQQFNLWEHRGKLVKSFSRGMRQKLSFAGAMLHDPKILILDEPLTGLDAIAAKQMKDILQDLVKQGITIILTTHILDVAERIADRIGIISRGKLVEEGSFAELKQKLGNFDNLENLFIRVVGA